MASNEERFVELGIAMPEPAKAGGVYTPCVRVGNLLYVSGCAPLLPGRVEAADGLTGARVGLAAARFLTGRGGPAQSPPDNC